MLIDSLTSYLFKKEYSDDDAVMQKEHLQSMNAGERPTLNV